VAIASANESTGGKGFDDSKTDMKRVRATAVEALALMHKALGKDEVWRLVDNAKNGQGRKECGANLRWALTTRFEDKKIARVSSQGLIEHCGGASEARRRRRSQRRTNAVERSRLVFIRVFTRCPGRSDRRGLVP
jgi:hypothetical protein